MKNRGDKPKHKKRYSKISIQKRLKLAKMVLEEGLTLTKVAKLLHIKRPTAKVILKRFKERGTFFQKKISQPRTKMEQMPEHEVSIQLPPSRTGELIKQQEAEPGNGGQGGHCEGLGYVVYYPVFTPPQGFM